VIREESMESSNAEKESQGRISFSQGWVDSCLVSLRGT
jgi:hypothetical protein